MKFPPPPSISARAFVNAPLPRFRPFLRTWHVPESTILFRALFSRRIISRMAAPNRSGGVALDLSLLGLSAEELKGLQELQQAAVAQPSLFSAVSAPLPPGSQASKARKSARDAGGDAPQPSLPGRSSSKPIPKRQKIQLSPGDAAESDPFSPTRPRFLPPARAPRKDSSAAGGKGTRQRKPCPNCGGLGHTEKKCPKARSDRQFGALGVADLQPSVRRRLSIVRDTAVPVAAVENFEQPDSEQNSDDSSVSGGSADLGVDSDADDTETGFTFKDYRWAACDVREPAPPPPPPMRSPPTFVSAPDLHPPPCKGRKARFRSKAQYLPKDCKSAADFVELLFPTASIQTFVKYTNRAAAEHPRLLGQKRFKKWRSTTVQEFKLLLCVCVYLGVAKLSNRKQVWKKDGIFEQRWITKRMTLWRFEALIQAWNCCPPWMLSDTALTAKNKADPYWQIQPLVAECNKRCKKYFRMGSLMSIDEGVIPFKGRHRARCYNPSKPAKYHLKKFCLNCAETGFVYCHYFYGGKGERRPAHISASAFPVCTLLLACPELDHSGRLLAVDNWFSGAQVAKACSQRGINFVGTCRAGRLSLETPKNIHGFPKEGVFKGPVGANRGDAVCHASSAGEHPCYVTSWQDSKRVIMLSSYEPKMGSCDRKVKMRGKWTLQKFKRPNVVSHYNAAMGGTDLHDMRLAFMRSSVKSNRWQVRVFIDMFSSMVTNAFTLKCLKEKRKKLHKYSEFDFITEYLDEVAPLRDDDDTVICAPLIHPATYTLSNGTIKIHKVKRPFWEAPAGAAWRLDGKRHYSQDANKVYAKFSTQPNGQTQLNMQGNTIRKNLRRNCRYCNKDTVYFCTKCDTALCLGTCFERFHTKKKLPALPKRNRVSTQ
jgi:hypothetical protein